MYLPVRACNDEIIWPCQYRIFFDWITKPFIISYRELTQNSSVLFNWDPTEKFNVYFVKNQRYSVKKKIFLIFVQVFSSLCLENITFIFIIYYIVFPQVFVWSRDDFTQKCFVNVWMTWVFYRKFNFPAYHLLSVFIFF